jgi:hypothetical protein
MLADLARAVAFRSVALNTVTETAGVLVGCKVHSLDLSEVEVVQFAEKLAKVDGVDMGPVYLGSRKITMTGTVYDSSRGAAADRLLALEAVMLPASGGFGTYALTFYTPRVTAPGYVQKSVTVRPNGLRHVSQLDMFGGPEASPLAIPWSVTFTAFDPTIT